MSHRPYPNADRAHRQVERHALEASSTPMREAEAAWATLPTLVDALPDVRLAAASVTGSPPPGLPLTGYTDHLATKDG